MLCFFSQFRDSLFSFLFCLNLICLDFYIFVQTVKVNRFKEKNNEFHFLSITLKCVKIVLNTIHLVSVFGHLIGYEDFCKCDPARQSESHKGQWSAVNCKDCVKEYTARIHAVHFIQTVLR